MANKNFVVKNNLEVSGGTIEGPATLVIDPAAVGDNTGLLQIKGNLQVDGTQTTINSTTLTVDDLNMVLASGAANSAAANGAGLTIDGASATMLYTHSTTSFDFNKPVNATNFLISGAQGSDGQLMTSTGSGVAWEDAPAGGLPLSGGTLTGDLDISDTGAGALTVGGTTNTYNAPVMLNVSDIGLAISDGTKSLALWGVHGGSSHSGSGIGTRSNHDMFIATNDTKRMVLDTNGKVLIGDTASHTSDFLQIETPDSGGGHGIQIRRNSANNDQGIGHILFGNNTDTDLVKISAKTDLDSNAGDSGALLFHTQVTNGNLTERMRIDSDGNVGIGIASPNEGGFGATSNVLSIAGTAQDAFGVLELISTDVTSANRIGEIRFGNLDGGSSFASNAGIRATRDGADNSSALSLWTTNGGTFQEGLAIRADAGNTTPKVEVKDAHPWIDMVAPDGSTFKAGITARGGSSSTQAQFHLHVARDSSYKKVSTAANYDTYLTTENSNTANGNLIFGTSLTERMRIHAANGYVGIGTTAPEHRLHIVDAGSAGSVTASSDKDTLVLENNTHGGMSVLCPDAAEAGIFTGHPSQARCGEFHTRYDTKALRIGTRGHDDFSVNIYAGNFAQAMKIHGGGEVSVGNTVTIGSGSKTYLAVGNGSGNATLSMYTGSSGYAYLNFADGTSGASADPGYIRYNHNDNTLLTNRVFNGDFNDTSDQRLKENIIDLAQGWNVIKDLKPRSFDWKDTDTPNRTGRAGFIAQEVETVLPQEVYGYEDENKAVNVTGIVAHLVKTVQELEARIATLEG